MFILLYIPTAGERPGEDGPDLALGATKEEFTYDPKVSRMRAQRNNLAANWIKLARFRFVGNEKLILITDDSVRFE